MTNEVKHPVEVPPQFAPVQNWDPLLEHHATVVSGPVLKIEYVCTCCECGVTQTVVRAIRCVAPCKHTYCEKCIIKGQDNMEEIIPADKALPLDLNARAQIEMRESIAADFGSTHESDNRELDNIAEGKK